jgi:hypothetical protein
MPNWIYPFRYVTVLLELEDRRRRDETSATIAEIEAAMRASVGPDGEDIALQRFESTLSVEELRQWDENIARVTDEARRSLRRRG